MKALFLAAFALSAVSLVSTGEAAVVNLQQPTATYSQSLSGDFSVGRAINGTTLDNLGWAIQDGIQAQTAVFETASDVGSALGSTLTFTLTQDYNIWPQQLMGRFRLSLTTDNRSTFADGLANGGDVTANWVVLTPLSYSSLNGTVLSKLGDDSILASGATPNTEVYTIVASTVLTGITGIRLEMIPDISLPFNGPGRQPLNGNFVLSEFEVSLVAVPEPAAWSVLCCVALVALVGWKRLRLRVGQVEA
jgi:hypothetical protein